MKQRARWFRVHLGNMSPRQIADALRRREYSSRRRSGFNVSHVCREYVAGTFIERVEWDDEIEDPVRGKSVVHRIDIQQVRFRINTLGPEMEMVNPPRSVRSFVGQLSECVGDSFSLAELTTSPMDWLRELEAAAGRVKVTGITASGISLSTVALAVVHVAGTEDVRKYLPRFTGNKPPVVERVVFETGSPRLKCELLENGRALVSGLSDETMDLLRNALHQLV